MFVIQFDTNGTYLWHTFMGYPDGSNRSRAIIQNSKGELLITGSSGNSWNGPEGETPLQGHSGGSNLFLLKLDGSGNYLWHEFFGGEGTWGTGLARDDADNIYISGGSNTSWTGPEGQASLNSNFKDGSHILAMKLDADGSYNWHTFYGSYGYDDGGAIARDSNGNIVITGYSERTWTGPADTAPLNEHAGGEQYDEWGNSYPYTDGYILKLDHNGTYQSHTFIGQPDSSDSCSAAGIGKKDRIYATCSTSGTWNGPMDQPPLMPFNGSQDIVVQAQRESGEYLWHSFIGSYRADFPHDLIADAGGNLHIAGYTHGPWSRTLTNSKQFEHMKIIFFKMTD